MGRTPELSGYKSWRHFALWLVLIGILMTRLPTFWLAGEFVAEDAWVFFAEAFNTSWTGSLLTPYAGYFHLLPRIYAEIISNFPLGTQPYLFAIVGLGTNAFIFSLFYLPHFRHLVASDTARAAICFTLALVHNSENMGFIMGQHWYLAFLLPMLLVMKAPANGYGKLGMMSASVLSAWSTPSNLALIPFLFVSALKDKDTGKRKWSTFTLINQGVVTAFILLLRIRDSERTGEFAWSHIPVALDRLILRGWMGTGLIGQPISAKIVAIQPWLLDVLGTIILVAVVALLYAYRRTVIGNSGITLLGASLLMIGLSMTRSIYLADLAQIELPRHVRYLTTPSLSITLFALIIGFDRLKTKLRFWFYVTLGCYSFILVTGLPYLNHWSREPQLFRFSNFVSDIKGFETEYRSTNTPAQLYVPSDVPYWGPVLRSGDQQTMDEDLKEGFHSVTDSGTALANWLAPYLKQTPSAVASGQHLGLLRFDGFAEGRVWFRDPEDRLLFTSELMFPKIWRMSGLSFELLDIEDKNAEIIVP